MQRRKCFSILPLLLLLTTLGTTTPAPTADHGPQIMPDELMSAVLANSAQPFAATDDGYQAHSGGLEVSWREDGLQTSADGILWSLALHGWGRGDEFAPMPRGEIAQTDDRLEYRRDTLIEWYRNTALGIEQGLSILQAPSGTGPLALQFDLTTDLAGRLDGDGRGLSFAAPDGRALRYDHLRAWDANNASLEAHLLYVPGLIGLEVDDRGAAYPITIDPLIYREQKITASVPAGIAFGDSVAISGDTALIGASYGSADSGTNYQGSVYVFIRSGTTWTLQQILTASDGDKQDEFGTAVALSGDTALVGADYDDIGPNADQGSAYVFVRSGTTWTQQAKLTASDGAASDLFGGSVALYGDTAIVGAFYSDIGPNVKQGSAYVFIRSGISWSLQQKLIASDGGAYHQFGNSVALSVDTALIGSTGADGGHGAAYVFLRGGTLWTQQTELTAPNGAPGDYFGVSVALSGNTALVGAHSHDLTPNDNKGSAYVFTGSGSSWTFQQMLLASDGGETDFFGISVALSGDTALVGASHANVGTHGDQGAAYIFSRSGTTWTQQIKLTASDGGSGDYFGMKVALSNNTALAGAFYHDIGAYHNQGSAYVFVWTGMAWAPQASLTAPEGAPSDHFGYSVAISGDTALVGVISDDIGANTDQGSVYVYTRSGTTWMMRQKLTASDGAADDAFGYSVAISGTTAIVGVPYKDIGANTVQGAAYVFVYNWPNWTQQAKLTAGDGTLGDMFGYSVALTGDTALVGAYLADIGSHADQGAAYVFTRNGTSWSQQQKLIAGDGATADRFGGSVALSGTTALVGAFLDTVGSDGWEGSAYVFVWTGALWAPQQHLIASDGRANDVFGSSVALSGDTALIGAPGHPAGANAFQGAAYVFARSGTTWSQQAQLTADDGMANDNFGNSVALSGDRAVVGASSDDVGSNANQGSAYFFTRSGTTWTQQAKWTGSDGAGSDNFGNSTALSGNTALVGSYFDDVTANVDQGSAYFYDVLIGLYLPMVER